MNNKPQSPKKTLTIRVSPELHSRIAAVASKYGVSINEYVTTVLSNKPANDNKEQRK